MTARPSIRKKAFANRAPVKDPIFRGGMPSAPDAMAILRRANRWREQYNPLVGLIMTRCRVLLEQAQRGEFADYQWTMKFVEERFPVLSALISRRTAAITELDWNIKTCSDSKPGYDQKLADDQAAALREVYERIDNLTETFEHLALATFRGFSHLQKHTNPAGDIVHLEPLDQWNFVRDGLYGRWFWNPDAKLAGATAFKPEDAIDPTEFVIREVQRSVNPIALPGYLYWGLCRKDHAGFVEIFGIPGGVAIGPPGVTPEKEKDFQAAAEDVSKGGSGYLPHGSTFNFADSPRGSQPFLELSNDVKQDIVLAGTGGLLTMLNEPTGLGSGQSNSHENTFAKIARAEAKKISELFQRSIDEEFLAEKFPGKPRLAYFELAANEETDTAAIVTEIKTLHDAGYQVSAEEVQEKTGYEVQAAPAPTGGQPPVDPAPGETDPAITNRSPFAPATPAAADLATAVASDLQHFTDRVGRVINIEDPQIREQKLREVLADWDRMKRSLLADPSAARVIERSIAAGLAAGFQRQPQPAR